MLRNNIPGRKTKNYGAEARKSLACSRICQKAVEVAAWGVREEVA